MMLQEDRQDLMAEIARRAGERKAQAQSILEKYARERDQKLVSPPPPLPPGPVAAKSPSPAAPATAPVAAPPVVAPLLARIERLETAVARIEEWVNRLGESQRETAVKAPNVNEEKLSRVLDTLALLTSELQSLAGPAARAKSQAAG